MNSSYIWRSKQVGLREIDEGVEEPDALLLEEIAFLDECRLHGLGRGGDGWAGAGGLHVTAGGLVRQSIIGKKMMSSGFLACSM